MPQLLASLVHITYLLLGEPTIEIHDYGHDIPIQRIEIVLLCILPRLPDEDIGAGLRCSTRLYADGNAQIGETLEIDPLRLPVAHDQNHPGLATGRVVLETGPMTPVVIAHLITPRCLIAGTASNLPSRYLLSTSVSFLTPSKSDRQYSSEAPSSRLLLTNHI